MATNNTEPQVNFKKGSGVLSDPQNAAKLLQITADTMFLLDSNGMCLDMDIRTERWFMQDMDYFIGKNLFKIIPEKLARELQLNFKKVLKTGEKHTNNYEVQIDGEIYHFKCIMSLYDKNTVLWQYRDITQRMLLKKKLEVVNKRLSEVEKVARIGQWAINLKTRELQFTATALGMDGNEEMIHSTLDGYLVHVHPDYRQEIISALDHFDKNASLGKQIDYQIVYNDTLFYIRLRAIHLSVNESGEDILEGYVQNISDLITKQRELEMITLAVQRSTDYIFAMDSNGQLKFGNHKFRLLHGFAGNEKISSKNLFDDIAQDHFRFRWKDIIQQLTTSQQSINFVLSKPIPEQSDLLAFDCTSYYIQNSQGQDLIWTFGKDITERVQYEKQVKELNQIMSTVLTNIPMNISVKDVDNDFKYIFSNSVGKKIHWGIMDDIIGKTDFDLYTHEEALKRRSDDMDAAQSKNEIRRLILDTDQTGETIVYDQLRLLVDDDIRPLLISIERDITKDKMMEQELIDAKVKAEESDKLKSAFIANMSHEIRTPLNAIVGFSKIIAETENPEERKSYFSIVETNNGRLLGLINEILDLSKIESGIMEFDMETIHVAALCQDIQQTMRLRCQPGVELIFEPSDPNLLLTTDKNRLSQVFNNLIGNAIKFTKNGTIRFGYRIEKNALYFYVSDTGKGIPEDKRQKVFDRFIKGDSFTQGTGLGLPICRSIVEKLGGKIYLESEVDKGTTFTFTLPIAQVVQTSILNMTKDGIKRKMNILVGEDSDVNYLIIEKLIGEEYQLKRAVNGAEVISMFQEMHPDLVLIDLKMPVMNGLDATRIIRSISKEIPIIAQTAYTFDYDREIVMEAGCNAFISKPYEKKQIIQLLKEQLNDL